MTNFIENHPLTVIAIHGLFILAGMLAILSAMSGTAS